MKQIMKSGLSLVLALILTFGSGFALAEGDDPIPHEISAEAHDPERTMRVEASVPTAEPPAKLPELEPIVRTEAVMGDVHQFVDGEPITDSDAPNEATVEEQIALVYNMAQFVPSANYGLLAWSGNKKRTALDGHTFTIGEEYRLRARFVVDQRVEPDVEYVYKLPSVLVSGKFGAQEKTISVNKKKFCRYYLSGDELRIVFSNKAAKYLEKGKNSVVIDCDFKEMLNESLIGAATTVTVSLPFKKGSATASIKIVRVEGQSAVDQLIEPPAVVPSPEVSFAEVQPVAEQQEPPIGEQSVEDQPSEEPLAAARSVTVRRVMPDIVRDGDPFRMEATMVGFEDAGYELQWQCDDGSGWQDVPDANGSAVELVANRDNVNYAWRILVTVV